MDIERGDRVTLDYVGRFEDGGVFATSVSDLAVEHDLMESEGTGAEASTPLSFTVGRGEVIEGLEEAVIGMTDGETATVTIPPSKGYGEYDPERVREYDLDAFERMVGRSPEIGLHVEADNGLHGDVIAVSEAVRVDFNHELAGRTLVFDLRVRSVE